MRKQANMVRCAFFEWLSEETKRSKDDMEEQFNKETKQGWRFAADAARSTDETAISRIASIRHVESLTQLEDPSCLPLGTKGESPKQG